MVHKMAVHSHPRGAARYLKVIDMKLFAWTMEHQFLFDYLWIHYELLNQTLSNDFI